MTVDWTEYNGKDVPPGFHRSDLVEIEYRDGRTGRGTQPWMFEGWIHRNWGGDIVRYRVINNKRN